MMNDVVQSTHPDMHSEPNGGGGGPADSTVNRLKRRVNSYRKLHETKLPAYEKAMNASNPQHTNESLMLGQGFQETTKTKKAPKKSTNANVKQSRAAGKSTKGSSANKRTKNNSLVPVNGQLQYVTAGRGGIKRPLPGDNKKAMDSAKRMNLDPGIKTESPLSVPDSNFDFKYSNSAESNKIGDNLFSKDDSLSFKDDSLGDFDGLMNNDTFNDLMSDLNIPTDFIDSFEFNDKNTLEDLSNVIGSEFGSASALDEKDDSFSSLSPARAGSGPGSNISQQATGSYGGNDVPKYQQHSQQLQQQNQMESNAADRLKIMAQQHQSTSQGACGAPMTSMPSSMVPQRMGSIDQMGGQPGGYHNSMQQSSMSNGHMNSGHMSPGVMQVSHQGQPQLVRDQNMHSRNVPNLPTMPLPPPMSSPMMTSGAQASTSDTPAMSTMSVAQMQQLPNAPHQQGSMHNMAMGNMTNGLMGNATNGPAHCGEGGGPPGGMTMYNNVSHGSMVDPAMVQRAQGRYRLGTPNGNPNMRPGMQMNHANQVMPGRNSPLGGGMQQPPVISNHNVRQQNPSSLPMQPHQQMVMHQMPINPMRPNLMGEMSSRGMMGPANNGPHMNHQINPQMNHQMNTQINHQINPHMNSQMNPHMNPQMSHHMNSQMNPQILMQMQQQQQQQQQQQHQQMQMQHHHQQMQQSRPPPPEYGKMAPQPQQNQNVPYLMTQMGMNVGASQNVLYPGNMPQGAPAGAKMGRVRPPQGFQQIPPSGPMMRHQVVGMGGPPCDVQQQQQMIRFPNGQMMMAGHPKQTPMPHPSPQSQHGPAMWNSGPGGHPMHANVPMGSASPHPQSPMQPTAMGSPRPQGDYPNHGSPMMPQPIRSQTPVGGMPNQLNQLQTNQSMMSHMRMQGSQMGPVHSPMSMLPHQQHTQQHQQQQQLQHPSPQQQQQQQQQQQLQHPSPQQQQLQHPSPQQQQLQHPSPQQQQQQHHQPSPMSHPHHSPMNSHLVGNGPNSFVPSPMNPSGPGSQASPDDYNLDFLDSPATGNPMSNGAQARGGSHGRGHDELIHLYNNR